LKFGSENQLNLSSGTPERRSMTGALPADLTKEGNGGSGAFLITIS